MSKIYELNKDEQKDLKDITNKYYMQPILPIIDQLLFEDDPQSFIIAFNHLHDIIRASESDVSALIDERVKAGEVKDAKQAAKSVVGNIFPCLLIYLFLKNKQIGNIQPYINITSKPTTRIKNFDKISTINIGDQDQQKPDCDLVIYSDQINNGYSSPQCIILSLKTSLRERAAQTYKWKLLLEIASDPQNSIKTKYNISYDALEMPLICFVTVNFYNEINNPQQRGMLKFFDRAFLAKNIEQISIESDKIVTESNFIYPLSNLVNFINEQLTIDT